jgi:ribosome maturation factor RimP
MERWSFMTKKQIESACEELVLPIIEERGFELVDVEYVKEGSTYYLRVYADKEGGITIDDCVEVSRALNPKLDAYDKELKDPYILEVSSPGLLRPLKKDKDFARNIGKMVEIKLFKPLDGSKNKEFEAELKGYDDKTITVLLEDDRELVIERGNLALIRLAFEW